jgi:predicted porin
VAGDCDGYPLDSVRYDSPVFAGFSVSASWGEDDMWAVSARYAGEFSGFKIAVATAYNESTDETGPFSVGPVFGVGHDASAWQVGAYVQHVPTGLFLYGAYANENQDAGFFANDPEGDMWYAKAGIRQRFTPLGHTVLYGEYGRDEDKVSSNLAGAGVFGSELERWGVGVVQEIDAAAMSLWLAYRHYEGDVDCADGGPVVFTCAAAGLAVGSNSLEDFDLVKAGALINF